MVSRTINAANFYAGFFEELTPEQMNPQLATSLGGPMNVTRAFLPTMRRQHSGKIISISSTAGLVGYQFCTAYSGSKFGLDGWTKALQAEVSSFGIQTMIVNAGSFRTELLTKQSTTYAAHSIEDYNDLRVQQEQFWTSRDGKQAGDPAKLARALVELTSRDELPRRFLAGADAVATTERKVAELQRQIDAHRELSSSLAIEDSEVR